MSHFVAEGERIQVTLTPEERVFLGDVLPLLAGVGAPGVDPAADRLRVPVYLDDPDSNREWWRLMGADLDSARRADRSVYQRMVTSEEPLALDEEEANAVLRVLNEARLALGARLGIDTESDHDELAEESRQVMDYLGWVLEELTVVLMRRL